jgi:uncharacterized membrane protein
MPLLIVGLVIFLGIHMVPMSPSLKESVLARIGERVYKLAFAFLSALGLVFIIVGFGQTRHSGQDIEVWSTPVWLRYIAFALMLPAFIMIVAAYVPSRIRALAGGHPMLLGVILWALAHLVANGSLTGLLLFGGFLVWAIADRISAGRRSALGPLGRKPGNATGDIIAIVVGCALYVLVLKWAHPLIIGVALVS